MKWPPHYPKRSGNCCWHRRRWCPESATRTEAPAADIVRPAGELDDPLVHLLGIPFDVTILGRRGAKEGPAGVRGGFLTCLTYEPGLDIDLAVSRGIADVGDVDVLHTNVEGTWDRVSAVGGGAACARARRSACVGGGDHGLAFPILRGVSQALPGKRIGVISVDAHFDVRITHHGEPSSGVRSAGSWSATRRRSPAGTWSSSASPAGSTRSSTTTT